MKKHTPIKQAASILHGTHSHLRELLRKIEELQMLNKKIAAYLDTSMQAYCQIANIVDSRLVLLVANSSIATHIRFQAPELLKKMQQDPLFKKITEIHCKISTTPTQHAMRKNTQKTKKMDRLAKETAAQIHALAQSIEDTTLREKLMKIAENTE